jgi:hypothetical protein
MIPLSIEQISLYSPFRANNINFRRVGGEGILFTKQGRGGDFVYKTREGRGFCLQNKGGKGILFTKQGMIRDFVYKTSEGGDFIYKTKYRPPHLAFRLFQRLEAD